MLLIDRQDGLGVSVVHHVEDVVSACFVRGGRVIVKAPGDVDLRLRWGLRPGLEDRRGKLLEGEVEFGFAAIGGCPDAEPGRVPSGEEQHRGFRVQRRDGRTGAELVVEQVQLTVVIAGSGR